MHDDVPKGVRHIGRKLDKQPAPPLRYVRRDKQCTDTGQPGPITTDLVQVDGVITRMWQRIYNGNVVNQAKSVARLCSEYKACIYRLFEYQVVELTMQLVWENFQSVQQFLAHSAQSRTVGIFIVAESNELQTLVAKIC